MGPEVEMHEADSEFDRFDAQEQQVSDDDEEDEEDSTFEYAELGYEKLDDCDEESLEAEQGSSSDDIDTSAVAAPVISVQTEQLIASEDLDAIKSVMSAIAMPESAVPDWAKSIPEALWLPKVEVKPSQSQSTKQQDDSQPSNH
ncbi:hypothetical protein BJ741DRAFT_574461 [Chytriomyces cf. hyalinus JEL632]|nr:hypothetical protein BJ741DRAFT_574461 [Chytriomyces cf. hyalinus JEL632]